MHRCWNHFAVFALSFIASLFLVTPASAQEFPADWDFVTLKTPHFDLIVNAKQQELGRFYAVKLEKAYSLVTPLFTAHPERTTVVLADKTDLTNGYATRIPYPHIFIYPVLPGPQDSLGETGDWVLELVAHEFTHIMTFESVTGTGDTLQHIFGTILSPNLLLPTWWKEGVAVQVESTVSQGGRLRSAYQDAVVREFSESDRLAHFDLGQINEVPPEWPEGLQPYVFGSVFWSEAVAEKGPKVIDQLHQRHGGRVPYFVEAPAHELLGASYETVHSRAIADLDDRAQKQITTLRRVPLAEGEPLQFETQFAQGPRISPDGERIAFIGVDERLRRSIRVLKRRAPTASFVDAVEEESYVNKREDIVQPPSKDSPASGSISRISWMPDSQHIVFDKVDLVSRYESYSDLWSFDTKTGKTERLTKGLRAREPFVTPDGRGILFVGLDGGRTWLGRYDFATKETKELLKGEWQDRISFPVQLADGSIVFAVRSPNGREGLRELPADGRGARPILDNYPDARFPEPTREGLLFASSKNGVHNLYLSHDYDSARPVSHTLGGMFASGVDPRTNDIYVTMLTEAGPKIHRLPAGAKPLPNALPTVDRLYADRYPKPNRDPADPQVNIETGPYQPGHYLWPRYWIPLVGVSAVNNSIVFEASTAGFDPLKKHEYSLAAGWDAGVKEASYSAAYQNNVFKHSLGLQALRTASYLVDQSTPIINEAQAVSIIPDAFKISRFFNAALAWQHRKTAYQGVSRDRTGPALTMQYADFGRTGTQISPEDGGFVAGSATHYVPMGENLTYTQYAASAAGYWSKGLPKRHALAARINSVYTQAAIGAIFGVSTTNYFYTPDPIIPTYVVRGYRVGHFYGKTLNTANLEYRFPVSEIRRGSGMDPYYITRLHGAVFVDGATLDGFAYRPQDDAFERVGANRIFGSAGFEARLETDIGYFLPVNLILGAAAPFSRTYSDGPGLIAALQLGTAF